MKWPNKKYKIGENHLCRSVFFVTQISQIYTDFFIGVSLVPQISQKYTDFSWDVFFSHADFADDADFFSWDFFIHRMPRNLFGGWLLRRLLTDFRGCDLYGRCRYPLRVENVPQISQIYTDFFSWDFFHRMPRNLFGGFLLRRLLTDFRGCDLSGRCRYPWDWTKRFTRDSIKICVNLWNLWDKTLPRRKICVISEICVTKKQEHI